MRVAVINWSIRKVGGVESYLSAIIPELSRVGCEVAFLQEVDEPVTRERIRLPEGALTWCVSDLGAERALKSLKDWQPDLLYTHIINDRSLEAAALEIAPAVFFAHAYYGTCISGGKTFKNPTVTPCNRTFGWQCLLHYYPHRCGGLSPVTMFKQYSLQSRRLRSLFDYKAIVTNSSHIRAEYIKHGLPPDRVHSIPFCVTPRDNGSAKASHARLQKGVWRLLFLGRMDFLKGGEIFLQSLKRVKAFIDIPLHVTFAGDGLERAFLEREAASLEAQTEGLKIEFPGWVIGAQLERLFAETDLLVMPSLWPEPFGLVGPEAGLYGVPAAAFAVGGISDWLTDGVNGHLADGNPPTAAGLAEAIASCLNDPSHYAHLRSNALEMAARFSLKNHLDALIPVFKDAAKAHD